MILFREKRQTFVQARSKTHVKLYQDQRVGSKIQFRKQHSVRASGRCRHAESTGASANASPDAGLDGAGDGGAGHRPPAARRRPFAADMPGGSCHAAFAAREGQGRIAVPVSYTHLSLPTILRV